VIRLKFSHISNSISSFSFLLKKEKEMMMQLHMHIMNLISSKLSANTIHSVSNEYKIDIYIYAIQNNQCALPRKFVTCLK